MIQNICKRAACLAAVAAMAGISGCTDAETPTSVSPLARSAQAHNDQAGIVREPTILRAFDVEMSASGSMQPGKPIEIHVRVRANLPVNDAELVVTTPDAGLPLVSTLDPRFARSVGSRVPARARRRGTWQNGQAHQENVRLTVPAPGYYRVMASVFSRSELPAFVDDSLRVVGDIHREIWLRVDKRGGRYTAQFDTLVFPAEAERRAGPLHCTVDLDEERRGKRRDAGCDGALITEFDSDTIVTKASGAQPSTMLMPGDELICPMSTSTCEDPCTVDPISCNPDPLPPPPPPADPCYAGTHLCIEFTYLDRSNRDYPVTKTAPEGTLVEASYQDRDCFIECWWEEERSTFLRLDAQGRVIIPCPSSSREKRLRTAYEFLDEFTAVSRDEWDGPTVQGTCPVGWRTVEMVPNQEAFVYGNVRKSAQRARLLFGYSSERVRIDFDTGSLSVPTSWYDAPLNVISINADDIWGNNGAGVQAHEYGHSYHHKALGGIGHIYVSSVDPSHTFVSESNGAKALLEGFAEFLETLVMPGRRQLHFGVRAPERYDPVLPVGTRAESRVAAYLWDVIDDGAEKGSAGEYLPASDPASWGTVGSYMPPEPYDQIRIEHSELGYVIRTCRVWGLIDTRPESIDGIHGCVRARNSVFQPYDYDRLYNRTVWGVGE